MSTKELCPTTIVNPFEQRSIQTAYQLFATALTENLQGE